MRLKYLLDSDTSITIIRRRPPAVLDHFKGLQPGDAGISVIVYLELLQGAVKSKNPDDSVAAVEAYVEVIPVIPMDSSVGLHYARIRGELERAGTVIGPHDMLIAAHALSLNLPLVTGNVREYNRVKGLRVENWIR